MNKFKPYSDKEANRRRAKVELKIRASTRTRIRTRDLILILILILVSQNQNKRTRAMPRQQHREVNESQLFQVKLPIIHSTRPGGAPPNAHVSNMTPPIATQPTPPHSASIPQQYQYYNTPQTTNWAPSQAQVPYNADFNQNISAPGMNFPFPLAHFMSYLPGFMANANLGYPQAQMGNAQYGNQVAPAATMAMPGTNPTTHGNVLPMPNTMLPPPNAVTGMMTTDRSIGNDTGNNPGAAPMNNYGRPPTNTTVSRHSSPQSTRSPIASGSAGNLKNQSVAPPFHSAPGKTPPSAGNKTMSVINSPQPSATEKQTKRIEQPMAVSYQSDITVSGVTDGGTNSSSTGSGNKDRNEVSTENQNSTSPLRPHDVTINIGTQQI